MNRRIVFGIVLSLATTFAGRAFAAGFPFASEAERTGFLKALAEQDRRYDPEEHMIRRPFSSPGYHTTLKGGYVHPTRDSLNYAVALLDSGEPERLERAEAILRRVIALQDQNPESRTYGIWSWFMEEPLAQMSPPDWNWADFCGTQLLQVAIDHLDRLPADLQREVRESILHACRSIQKRDVKPGYTNIAIMGAYVTHVAGELFGEPEILAYGKMRVKRFYDYTMESGSFSEYNSPTYTIVAIKEITRLMQHVKNPTSRKMIEELNRFAWRHMAVRFHPPTKQWSGPHSRCYRTILGRDAPEFIQRATGGAVTYMPPADAYESLDAHRLNSECPKAFFHYFTKLDEPRIEREVFKKASGKQPAVVGTTYLHPKFSLGSVSVGDTWNQRRPLLAYWKTPGGGAGALRVQLLHDGYDYASGRFFSVQDKGDVLAAIGFATDGGDTHVSLDRIKDGTIKAKDLRLRFLFEGDINDLVLPETFFRNAELDLRGVKASICISEAIFDDRRLAFESGRDDRSAWLDCVLYNGDEREFDFRDIKEAAIVYAISMTPKSARAAVDNQPLDVRISHADGNLTAEWKIDGVPNALKLTVPVKPDRSSSLGAASTGQIGGVDAWK